MISAKKLFQASPAFKDFAKLLEHPSFEAACHAALMDMIESMPPSGFDVSKGWDSYSQILGARLVLERLSKLYIPDDKMKPEPKSWKYPSPSQP